MPPTRRARRPEPIETYTPAGIMNWFRQWLAVREEKKFLEGREKELHHRICGAIEENGYRDDKGSLFLDLEEPVEGFGALKYERRVLKSLNEDRAVKLIRDKDVVSRCTALILRLTDQERALQLLQQEGLLVPGATIEFDLDEEEILKCHYEEIIDQEELDSIFDISETYAFKQVKE
jgi:hypothetical protein